MNPRLIAISGPLSGVFRLGDGDFTLGREDSNSLTVPDKAVSRRHCVIRRSGGGFLLVDLESRNGSFVNNVSVREHDLKHSDRIGIGDSQFIFLVSDEGGVAFSSAVELDDSRIRSGHTVELKLQDAALLHPQRLLDGDASRARQARDLEALIKVCQALDPTQDIATLAKGLLNIILDLVPADRGAVLTAEDGGEIRAVYGRWQNEDGARTVPVSRTLLKSVLEGKSALMCNDVMQDARIRQTESMVASPIASVLVVPILGRNQPSGVIYLAASSLVQRFDDPDLQLVAGLASVSAPAFESAREVERLKEENRRLQGAIEIEHRMVGNSAPMEQVYRFIEKAAPASATVLITGESGTGKELVARALHRNSGRSSGPFVALNSAAIAEGLMETTLFGNEKGAYTSALTARKGLLEAANGGTFFLDEIGDMPLPLQSKLLRVIQEREFERVGGTETRKVDIRIIAATHRNLAEMIREGSFRHDLHFRIKRLSVSIPPLRERRDDVMPLARHFLDRHGTREKRRDMEFSHEAEACLKQYEWPGNVRELENVVEHLVVMAPGRIIQPADLPEDVRDNEHSPVSRGRYYDAIREAKKQVIRKALKDADGVVAEAARLLALQPTHLHRLIRTLGLREPTKRDDS